MFLWDKNSAIANYLPERDQPMDRRSPSMGRSLNT